MRCLGSDCVFGFRGGLIGMARAKHTWNLPSGLWLFSYVGLVVCVVGGVIQFG
jgi:hypothetical protein